MSQAADVRGKQPLDLDADDAVAQSQIDFASCYRYPKSSKSARSGTTAYRPLSTHTEVIRAGGDKRPRPMELTAAPEDAHFSLTSDKRQRPMDLDAAAADAQATSIRATEFLCLRTGKSKRQTGHQHFRPLFLFGCIFDSPFYHSLLLTLLLLAKVKCIPPP